MCTRDASILDSPLLMSVGNAEVERKKDNRRKASLS